MNGSFFPSRPICYSEREKKAQTMRHKKPSRGSNSSNGIKAVLHFSSHASSHSHFSKIDHPAISLPFEPETSPENHPANYLLSFFFQNKLSSLSRKLP